jgi:hypothetical protein
VKNRGYFGWLEIVQTLQKATFEGGTWQLTNLGDEWGALR